MVVGKLSVLEDQTIMLDMDEDGIDANTSDII